MPVKHLTEEHRALLTEKCSVLENPPLPDLPTVPKKKRDWQASAEEQELHRSKRPRNSVSKEEEEEEEDFEDLVLDYDHIIDDDNDAYFSFTFTLPVRCCAGRFPLKPCA